MKNLKQVILFIGMFFIITTKSFSQSKEQELSNAEKFSSKAGSLIQKEYITVGRVKDVRLSIINYTDLITNAKQSALKFEYDTKSALLDADEVIGLIKSIKIIQEKIFPSTVTYYTEVSFKSRSGFDAGCYHNKGVWSTYLRLEKYDKDSLVFLEKDDFTLLLSLLEQAKTKI